MTASSSDARDPVERLAEEFLERQRRGERPTVSEYAKLHPDWAERIENAFSALQLMEHLKPRSGEHTDDFDHAGNAVCSPLGEHLGDYRILREIGRGGMGVVYEALQVSLGRRVALKVLPMHGRINPVQMERFRLEARSAARLHHTNIVPVYGVGEHDGVPYYAMQYIPGHGLDEVLEDVRRLRAGGPQQPRHAAGEAASKHDNGSLAVARSFLTGRFGVTQAEASQDDVSVPSLDGDPTTCGQPEPIFASATHGPSTPSASGAGDGSVLSHSTVSGYHHAVAQVGLQVARALSHAHELGVLHRDIKPSNLLLDAGGRVWVTDFGLAKLEGSEGPTQAGDVVGTLRYMAPERFDGWSDRRSDVYGLGMTLYELLTLHPAFEASTRAKLIDQVIHDPAPPPHRHDPKVPRDLETIVVKAISKEPGDRYATADALAADLENFLADKPILARRSRLPERAWRWCRRNPVAGALVGVSGVTFLALMGLGVALFIQSQLRSAFKEVDRQRGIAEQALGSERSFLYQNRVLFAQRELDDNDVERTEQLLSECSPDRRAWEWHYLKRQCHTELLTMTGHAGTVYAVAASPDGRWIASGGDDKTIRIWDGVTGNLVQSLPGHEEAIQSLAFSPDGTRLASIAGSLRNPDRLLVHEVATWLPIINRDMNTGEMCGLAYSRDGRYLAVTSGEQQRGAWVQMLDSSSGKDVSELPIPISGKWPYLVSFDRDGTRLVAVFAVAKYQDPDQHRNQMIVWDVTSRRVRQTLDATGVIFAVFSPDGRRIASSGIDGTLRVLDAADGRELHSCRGHRSAINNLTFSPDSRRVASVGDDSSARIWDVETGEELLHLRGHRKPIYGVAFSTDGRRIVTSSTDGEVKVFDAIKGPEAMTLPANQGPGNGIAFSPDGKRRASCGMDHTLKLWDVPSGQLLATWTEHNFPVWRAAFSPDGLFLASTAGDWTRHDILGEIIVRDAITGRVIRPLRAHQGIARGVAFSPNSRLLATGGGESRTPGQELILWDVTTGRRRHTFQDLPGGILDIAFTRNGQHVFTATGKTIRVWEVESGRPVTSFEADGNLVHCFAVSPNGQFVVSGGYDQMIKVWDVSTGQKIRSLSGQLNDSNTTVFSPDGRRIAMVGSDKLIRVWDFESGQGLVTLKTHAYSWGIAFSPDGRFLASNHQNGELKLWNGSPTDAGGR
jgi:eukaryotic-like serine/threonine-protein kinase